ncbi:unnamed protein product [Peronospora farinosa]|uniref:Uncharacterized protein n=1 Tax=Peronospora farinosa TaxID=134698 RepID=A0AAV0UDX6_9STRA|nr:unnamed protein product [Peronospora farinosa]
MADFRQDQLGFLSDNATSYVELLQQLDKAADTTIMDAEEKSSTKFIIKTQLVTCHEESQDGARKLR